MLGAVAFVCLQSSCNFSRAWVATSSRPDTSALTGRHAGGESALRRSPAVARWAEGEASSETAPAVPGENPKVRVGVLFLKGHGEGLLAAFEKLNVTNETFFQTEVPDAFQFPLAAKLLAMSNTVDVVVAAYGPLGEEKSEILRGFMTIALTTNVPIVPCDVTSEEGIAKVADTAVQMAEIRQQAMTGTSASGTRKNSFFGIGKGDPSNRTANPGDKDPKKGKVYF